MKKVSTCIFCLLILYGCPNRSTNKKVSFQCKENVISSKELYSSEYNEALMEFLDKQPNGSFIYILDTMKNDGEKKYLFLDLKSDNWCSKMKMYMGISDLPEKINKIILEKGNSYKGKQIIELNYDKVTSMTLDKKIIYEFYFSHIGKPAGPIIRDTSN